MIILIKTMKKSHRLLHLLVWSVFLVAVPFLLFKVIIQTPEVILTDHYYNFSNEKNIFKNTQLALSIKNDKLKVLVKQPFKNASAVFFLVDNSGQKRNWGELKEMGEYYFPLSSLTKEIIIYDGIKKAILIKKTIRWE